MPMTSVQGPLWSSNGLDYRNGRYPLAVESPVLNMVDRLVPGVSTLTQTARYYSLYWALADFATQRNLDSEACLTVLRRSEVALAWASIYESHIDASDVRWQLHGADRVRNLVGRGAADRMAEPGRESYSPRKWGFWSQYGSPSIVVGLVTLDRGALRVGDRRCPPAVLEMFQPLFDRVVKRPISENDLPELISLADISIDSSDIRPLRDVMLAVDRRVQEPDGGGGNDATRRSVFRLLARAVQLQTQPRDYWTEILADAIAYGAALGSDHVLSQEDRAAAWRGVLLRHHSVGAWRRLWSALVERVQANGDPVTGDELHEWIRGCVSTESVGEFLRSAPNTVDSQGNPQAAELEVNERLGTIEASLAVLLLGARRNEQLSGLSLHAFRGGRSTRQFLDPNWIQFRHQEHLNRSLADFGCTIVDDMLAQSQRVALRKLRFDDRGRMTVFSKLRERDGQYYALSREGSGNVGLRIEQIGGLAMQLGVLEAGEVNPTVTALGRELLDLG